MNMQSTKLELIKLIADIQSEELLDRVRLFLKEVESEMKASDKPPALSKEETELLLKVDEVMDRLGIKPPPVIHA